MVVRSSVEHLLYPVAGVEPVTDKDKDKDKDKEKEKEKDKDKDKDKDMTESGNHKVGNQGKKSGLQ